MTYLFDPDTGLPTTSFPPPLPAPLRLPLVYAMQLDLNGAVVDGYQQGDLVLFNTLEEPVQGDLVVIYHKTAGSFLMVLRAPLGSGVFLRMPFVKVAGDDVVPLIVGRILGTTGLVRFKATDLWAIHKCGGKVDPEDCRVEQEAGQ